MFHFVDHVFKRPNFGAPFLTQMRGFQEMIAVHVGDDDGVDGFQAEVLSHAVERGIKEVLVQEAAVHYQAPPAIRQYEPKIWPEVPALKLKQMWGDLNDIGHYR